MVDVPWGKFPTLTEDQEARRWLQFMANIGRAPNAIDAYGRAVEDHLRFCAGEDTEPLYAKADTVAAWVGEMLERPPVTQLLNARDLLTLGDLQQWLGHKQARTSRPA
ncbi:hypothetical protein [Streptomyces sp. NPDC059819]|uniref:hypothetical protein n=1 Tax=Streptomyces sp. NPDC059819 TaxID=3346963 RepID=UPI0036612601